MKERERENKRKKERENKRKKRMREREIVNNWVLKIFFYYGILKILLYLTNG